MRSLAITLMILLAAPLLALDEPPADLKADGIIMHDKRQGTWTFTNADGLKRFEIDYVLGQRTGSFKEWNTDGKLVVLGETFADKRHGSWSEFHANGELKNEGVYFAGTRHGDWGSYHDNGKIAERGSFALGIRQGPWYGFFPGGATSFIGNYLDDKKHGEWVFYHTDSVLSEQGFFKANIRDGRWREWDTDGALVFDAQYSDGTLTAVSVQPGEALNPRLKEVHLCAVLRATGMRGNDTVVDGKPLAFATVRLTRTGLSQVLVLTAREPVQWTLDLAPGVVIDRIVLAGLTRQLIANPPAGVPVEAKFASDGDADELHPPDQDDRTERRKTQYIDRIATYIGESFSTQTFLNGGRSIFNIGRTATRLVVPPEDAEMYAVGVYHGKGGQRGKTPGSVAINVKRTGVPIVLFLCAYESVEWAITLEEGVDLRAIIMSGYYVQTATGVPESTKLMTYPENGGRGMVVYRDNSSEYSRLTLVLRDITGLELNHFQHGYEGTSFDITHVEVVIPPPPADARLRVVCAGDGAPVPGKADEKMVTVQVTDVAGPLVLVLGSDHDITWLIEPHPRARIERIILIGKGKQRVRNRPPAALLENMTEPAEPEKFISIIKSSSDPEAVGLKLTLKDHTGLDAQDIQASTEDLLVTVD